MKLSIVERMNKCSFGSGKRTLLERFPCDIVWHWNEFGAERSHPFDLRLWRGLNHDDATWHACLFCGVSDALSCVTGANRPDAAFALGFRQHRHRICGAAQLISIDWLEILQFEADVRLVRA